MERKWGRHLPDFRARAAKGDAAMLAKVLAQPQIDEDTAPYFAAFLALQRDRPILGGGMVVLPLPVPRHTIEQHARRIGIDDGELVEFVEIVARIDDLYVRHESERILTDLKAGRGRKG